MKTITKHCTTLKQAERYQNKLYDQYNSVQLVRAPLFSEEGTYQWQVSN